MTTAPSWTWPAPAHNALAELSVPATVSSSVSRTSHVLSALLYVFGATVALALLLIDFGATASAETGGTGAVSVSSQRVSAAASHTELEAHRSAAENRAAIRSDVLTRERQAAAPQLIGRISTGRAALSAGLRASVSRHQDGVTPLVGSALRAGR